MTVRIRCLVPFCTRTVPPRVLDTVAGGLVCTEVICGRHYRTVPAAWRAVYRRVERDFCLSPLGANGDRIVRLWRRIKRHAVEAAAGLA